MVTPLPWQCILGIRICARPTPPVDAGAHRLAHSLALPAAGRPRSLADVKFKVRCSRYLYTLVVTDSEKAEKLKQSLPPGLQVKDLTSDK